MTCTEDAEKWSESRADVLIICDTDADRAARAKQDSKAARTAVFVGDITIDEERRKALEFACETFNVGSDQVLIAVPG